MGALSQLTDEQLSVYRDLLAAKQAAAAPRRSKYGGIPVDDDEPQTGSRFGGIPVNDEPRRSKFGGIPIDENGNDLLPATGGAPLAPKPEPLATNPAATRLLGSPRTVQIPETGGGMFGTAGRYIASGVDSLRRAFDRLQQPGLDAKLGGASDVVRTVGKAALPLAAPSLIASPLRAGASLALGTGVGAGMEKAGKALFPDHPGAAEAAGTAVGLTAGGLTPRIPGLNRSPSLAPRPEVSLSRGSTIPGDIIQIPESVTGRPSLGKTAADVLGLVSPRARYGFNVLNDVRDLFGRSSPATQPGASAPAPRPLFPATGTPAAPGLPQTRTPLGLMPSEGTIPSPVARGPRIIELKDPETGRAYGHMNIGIPEEAGPQIPASRIRARLEEADQPAARGPGSKPTAETQPAARQGTLKRAEANEYADAVRKAGFRTDPASLPGNQAGVSLSSSFMRNARGQTPPTAIRLFRSENLPAFAAREGIAPEEAVRRLKANGWAIRQK